MPEDVHAAASAAICDHLLNLPEVAAARIVHTFWPSVARREVDLRPLLRRLHAQGVTIVLPRVAAHEPRRMAHHAWDGTPLPVGAFGLEEPPEGEDLPPETFDVVLVPALAADRRGVRLGYGKGFYDAFLPHTPALRVVPLFDACLAEALPAEPHDEPVHVIVTETQTLRISSAPLQKGRNRTTFET